MRQVRRHTTSKRGRIHYGHAWRGEEGVECVGLGRGRKLVRCTGTACHLESGDVRKHPGGGEPGVLVATQCGAETALWQQVLRRVRHDGARADAGVGFQHLALKNLLAGVARGPARKCRAKRKLPGVPLRFQLVYRFENSLCAGFPVRAGIRQCVQQWRRRNALTQTALAGRDTYRTVERRRHRPGKVGTRAVQGLQHGHRAAAPGIVRHVAGGERAGHDDLEQAQFEPRAGWPAAFAHAAHDSARRGGGLAGSDKQ